MRNLIVSAFIIGFSAMGATDARATCGPMGYSISDLSVYNVMSCDTTLVHNIQKNYTFGNDSSWDDWGSQDGCNVVRPFGKMVAAVWELENGMVDYPFGWHASSVYINHAQALRSPDHATALWKLDTNLDVEGLTAPWDGQRFLCTVGCETLGAGGTGTTVTDDDCGNRAAMIVHEMHHAAGQTHSYAESHITGPFGNCSQSGPACDWFYPHGRTAFIGKDLNYVDYTSFNGLAKAFHSPYQVTVEMLCDETINASPNSPLIVQRNGMSFAKTRADQEFVNAVMYRCGKPMPFYP